jgi:hypothetical protein
MIKFQMLEFTNFVCVIQFTVNLYHKINLYEKIIYALLFDDHCIITFVPGTTSL